MIVIKIKKSKTKQGPRERCAHKKVKIGDNWAVPLIHGDKWAVP